MVDFASRERLYGLMFNAPKITDSVHSFREQYRDNESRIFKSKRAPPHDCRSLSMQEFDDKKEWDTWLFSHGLNATFESKENLHCRPKAKDPDNKPPEKLLYTFGEKGNGRAQFKFPRGITTDTEGDILIVDSGNHRVQRYNSSGIYKNEFGSKGSFRGELLNPTDVTTLDNDDVVVCDSGNCRVQIFRPHGRLKHFFNTKAKPAYLACDNEFNIIVSTAERTVEIYNVNRKLIGEFSLGAPTQGPSIGLPIAVTESGDIIICDTSCNIIKTYSYDGKLLNQFEAVAAGQGLGLKAGGIALNPIGQIIVIDSLNHTVNLYSDRGVLIQRLLYPADDLGTAQSCAVGPEGHLIVAEFSINGPHLAKIFRYGECECHRSKGGTSRRTTPIQSPA